MKNTLIILITSFVFIVAFSSCKKTDINNLTGQWQWQYSIGGISTHTIKPENNKKVLLILNQNSSFSVTENGTVTLKGTYHLTSDKTYGKIIHFNPVFLEQNGEIYTIKNNQLILTDYMVSDGFTSYYERIK